MYINCLELLAETLAIKSFARERDLHTKHNSSKFGDTVTPQLNRLTKELWLLVPKKKQNYRGQSYSKCPKNAQQTRSYAGQIKLDSVPKVFITRPV